MTKLTPEEIDALERRSKRFNEMLTKAGKADKKRTAMMKNMMRRRRNNKGGK